MLARASASARARAARSRARGGHGEDGDEPVLRAAQLDGELDLDRRLAGLDDAADDRLQRLAGRAEDLGGGEADVGLGGETVDGRLAGVHSPVAALAVPVGQPRGRPGEEGLEDR